jgi:hypothetical protein
MHRPGTTCGETIGLQGPGGGNDQQKRQKLEHVYVERGVSVNRSMGDQGKMHLDNEGEEWDGLGRQSRDMQQDEHSLSKLIACSMSHDISLRCQLSRSG